MNKFNLILISFLVCFFSILQCAEKSVELSASATEVFENDVFELSIILKNFDTNNLSLQRISFNNVLKVIQGPFQSQQTSVINGSISSNLTLVYRVSPLKKGVIVVPPIVILDGSKQYASNELKISVFANGTTKVKNGKSLPASKKMFIKTELSRISPYVGEPFVLKRILYVNPNIKLRKPEILENSVLKGFLKEESNLSGAKGRTLISKIYQGKKYNTLLVQEIVLTPTRSGEIKIPQFSLNVPIQEQRSRRRSSAFEDSFFQDDIFSNFSNFTEKVIKSNEKILKVKDLPLKNKPKNFSGIVGDYKLESSISSTDITIDNSLTLTIKISGKGNIKSLQNIDMKIPKEFESYQPVRKEQLSSSTSGIITFEQILIAREDGDINIKPAEFTYFNIKEGKYVTLKTLPYKIAVTGSSKRNYTSAIPDNFSKEEIKFLGKDISFVKTEYSNLYSKDLIKNPYKNAKNILIFSLFFPLAVLGFKNYFDRKFADPVKVKRLRAFSESKKSLKTIKSVHLQNVKKDFIPFYEGLSNLLYDFLAAKLNIVPSGIVFEELMAKQLFCKLKEEDLRAIMDILKVAETVRYSSETTAERDFNQDFNQVQAFIESVNNLL